MPQCKGRRRWGTLRSTRLVCPPTPYSKPADQPTAFLANNNNAYS